MTKSKISSYWSLVAVIVTFGFGTLFFVTYTAEAQKNKQPAKSLFDEHILKGEKTVPTVVGQDTFSDMIRRELVAPKPDMAQILASKGKRPRNPPTE